MGLSVVYDVGTVHERCETGRPGTAATSACTFTQRDCGKGNGIIFYY